MKIYVASSWRNPSQPGVVAALRKDGHEVYDFRNPSQGEHGFSWTEIGVGWQNWTADEYVCALAHPISEHGYRLDFDAMNWCDACVMVLPCGASAHTEAGWCKGAGKKTAVLLLDRDIVGHSLDGTVACSPCGDLDGCHLSGNPAKMRGWEPELMYKMHDLVTPRLDVVRHWLRILETQADEARASVYEVISRR